MISKPQPFQIGHPLAAFLGQTQMNSASSMSPHHCLVSYIIYHPPPPTQQSTTQHQKSPATTWCNKSVLKSSNHMNKKKINK